MKLWTALLLVGGCASGQSALQGGDGGGTGGQDSGLVGGRIDAPGNVLIDAHIFHDAPTITIDAFVQHDAPPPMIDAAPPMIDAPPAPPDACVPILTEVLANPAFDLPPIGTAWNQTPIDPSYPPITADGILPQTSPYQLWLGGIVSDQPGDYATDIVYQDVAVPANTTKLEMTGYWHVETGETDPSNIYDYAELDLRQPDGTLIEAVGGLSNLTPNPSYAAFDYVFAAPHASQTVRVYFTSSNDFSNVTDFFFDSLTLVATHCP